MLIFYSLSFHRPLYPSQAQKCCSFEPKPAGVINLCSDSSGDGSSDSNSDDCIIIENFSPIKAKTNPGPSSLIDRIIPDVCRDDFHNPGSPILARPSQGLSVLQLFQLIIGLVPGDRICCRKPTGVTYSSVFVVDLHHVTRIEDLRADDNGAWVHGGKYIVELDETSSEVISALPVKQGSAGRDE